jgi:hypothetical protein
MTITFNLRSVLLSFHDAESGATVSNATHWLANKSDSEIADLINGSIWDAQQLRREYRREVYHRYLTTVPLWDIITGIDVVANPQEYAQSPFPRIVATSELQIGNVVAPVE